MALVVAIDGPAASGKGTIAKAIAERFDLPHLDTGLLYRATALALRRRGRNASDITAAIAAARELHIATLDDSALRSSAIGDAASIVAAIPDVRAALIDLQRSFARNGKGSVLDGRDIGTFICPDAAVKIYVTASAEARAKRRAIELTRRGEDASYESVLADIRRRDERDTSRATAPLKKADDAIVLDNTDLNAEESAAAGIAIVQEYLASIE